MGEIELCGLKDDPGSKVFRPGLQQGKRTERTNADIESKRCFDSKEPQFELMNL
jgi:hypothetical protein